MTTADSMPERSTWEAPRVFRVLAEELLTRVGASPRDRVLDVASGFGAVSAAARARGLGAVTALDIDIRRLRVAGGSSRCQGDAQDLPFEAGCFSLVTCHHGLMFITRRRAALAAAARVLRPSGRYGATCWHGLDRNPGFEVLHRAVREHLGSEAASQAALPFSLPDPGALAREAEAAGFARATAVPIDVSLESASADSLCRWYLFGTSVARFARGDGAAASRVLEAATAELARFEGAAGVHLPASAYCLVAERT